MPSHRLPTSPRVSSSSSPPKSPPLASKSQPALQSAQLPNPPTDTLPAPTLPADHQRKQEQRPQSQHTQSQHPPNKTDTPASTTMRMPTPTPTPTTTPSSRSNKMANRFTRIFSQVSQGTNKITHREPDPGAAGTMHHPPDNPRPISTPLKSKTPSRESSRISEGRKEKSRDSSHPPQTSSSTTSTPPATTATATTSSTTTRSRDQSKERKAKESITRRFELRDDGTHKHALRATKRQEKLSALWRDMFGGGKKKADQQKAQQAQIAASPQPAQDRPPPPGDAQKDKYADKAGRPNNNNGGATDDQQQLSLMSTWVEQLKLEKDKAIGAKKAAPTSAVPASLADKYGKCHEVVGRGAFGVVRISHKTDPHNTLTERLFAIKEFRRRPQETPKSYQKRLTSEFCISSSLRHPNIIHTLDLMPDAKNDYCAVMEYCSGGDLYTLILAAGKLELAEADCFFKQTFRGVEYMHEMGVAHRDLKPENLLLTTNGAIKITDFGNSECFRMAWEKDVHLTAGLCGSAPYIAPEEYRDREFDPRAVDVWATGVIYMAMRTGRHLWRIAQEEEDEYYARYLEQRRDENGYTPIESLQRSRCRNVIYSILDPNPARRITASQVLKSEWLREVKVCDAGQEGF